MYGRRSDTRRWRRDSRGRRWPRASKRNQRHRQRNWSYQAKPVPSEFHHKPRSLSTDAALQVREIFVMAMGSSGTSTLRDERALACSTSTHVQLEHPKRADALRRAFDAGRLETEPNTTQRDRTSYSTGAGPRPWVRIGRTTNASRILRCGPASPAGCACARARAPRRCSDAGRLYAHDAICPPDPRRRAALKSHGRFGERSARPQE